MVSAIPPRFKGIILIPLPGFQNVKLEDSMLAPVADFDDAVLFLPAGFDNVVLLLLLALMMSCSLCQLDFMMPSETRVVVSSGPSASPVPGVFSTRKMAREMAQAPP